MITNITLTTSKVINLDLEDTPIIPALPPCKLKWKKERLWVTKIEDHNDSIFLDLPALRRSEWLANCLRYSAVKQVCLDLSLGETGTRVWADACHQAKKQVFLRMPSYNKFSTSQSVISWNIKRLLDVSVSFVLLTVLSPVILAIIVLIKLSSPGPIFFRQWRVGKRGKLFKMYKFRSMDSDAEKMHHQVMGEQLGLHKHKNDPRITAVGKWLRKYSLDEIPQLFNVIKGEMSLVGPRPWALYDALRLGKMRNQRLNALPGITGAWQVQARSNLLDLEEVTQCDLEYLHSWSLKRDFNILLVTFPKVIFGDGAY